MRHVICSVTSLHSCFWFSKFELATFHCQRAQLLLLSDRERGIAPMSSGKDHRYLIFSRLFYWINYSENSPGRQYIISVICFNLLPLMFQCHFSYLLQLVSPDISVPFQLFSSTCFPWHFSAISVVCFNLFPLTFQCHFSYLLQLVSPDISVPFQLFSSTCFPWHFSAISVVCFNLFPLTFQCHFSYLLQLVSPDISVPFQLFASASFSCFTLLRLVCQQYACCSLQEAVNTGLATHTF